MATEPTPSPEEKVEAAQPAAPAAEEEAKTKKQKKSDKKAETDALKAEAERLQKELDESKDRYLRTLAEYDNFRKRSQREKDAAYGDAKADTLKALLPVIDNFDRAAENKTDDIETYRKGVEMIVTQFSEILKRLAVESFGEVGEPFDPNLHNAVMTVESSDELPENTIAAVFEKGYRVGERVLRCATVQVTQ